jgi:hypothetical protein
MAASNFGYWTEGVLLVRDLFCHTVALSPTLRLFDKTNKKCHGHCCGSRRFLSGSGSDFSIHPEPVRYNFGTFSNKHFFNTKGAFKLINGPKVNILFFYVFMYSFIRIHNSCQHIKFNHLSIFGLGSGPGTVRTDPNINVRIGTDPDPQLWL